MTITDLDLSDLLDALRSGEVTDTIRTSLEWILQQLIETEPPRRSAQRRINAPTPGPRSATATGLACWRRRLVASS